MASGRHQNRNGAYLLVPRPRECGAPPTHPDQPRRELPRHRAVRHQRADPGQSHLPPWVCPATISPYPSAAASGAESGECMTANPKPSPLLRGAPRRSWRRMWASSRPSSSVSTPSSDDGPPRVGEVRPPVRDERPRSTPARVPGGRDAASAPSGNRPGSSTAWGRSSRWSPGRTRIRADPHGPDARHRGLDRLRLREEVPGHHRDVRGWGGREECASSSGRRVRNGGRRGGAP